jgi:hypothetical protein
MNELAKVLASKSVQNPFKIDKDVAPFQTGLNGLTGPREQPLYLVWGTH